MQELQVIDQREVLGKGFRLFGTPAEPLFLARDVAEWIDYDVNKVGQMLSTVDESEKLTATIYRSGQNREMWFLTEDGLYEVLFQSRKPIAKQFKGEVKRILKEIRRSGGYIISEHEEEFALKAFPSLSDDLKCMILSELHERAALLVEKNTVLEEKTLQLEANVALLEPTAIQWADRQFIIAAVQRYSAHVYKGMWRYSYGWNSFKRTLRYQHRISINGRLAQHFETTGHMKHPGSLNMLKDEEVPLAVQTIVGMCMETHVDLSDLIAKLANPSIAQLKESTQDEEEKTYVENGD